MSKLFYMIDNKSNIRGLISYDYDEKRKIGTIKSLFVDDDYRGKGIGTALLWKLHDYIIMNNKNIKYVEIDDCSDNYRLENNIYLKIGAKYNKKMGPEMRWKIGHINVRNNKRKYRESVKEIYNIVSE